MEGKLMITEAEKLEILDELEKRLDGRLKKIPEREVSGRMEIEEQPTAYDVDKVVAELTKRAEEFAWGVSEFQDGYYAGMKEGFRQAIQIIKGGGVDG